MIKNISIFCIKPTQSIREVIACIDKNQEGIALVVDKQRHLLGTVTDGDIRRAILAGVDLDSSAIALLENRTSAKYAKPIVAPLGTPKSELLRLMNEHVIWHVPLLNKEGKLADMVLISDFVKEAEIPLTAIIMAGGYGTRLSPLTKEIPKPMLSLGEGPILKSIIKHLQGSGIRRIHISTHYKPEKIIEYFGDGSSFGVDLQYLTEDHPLGTAGALGLMSEPKETLLVMNADILTALDIRAMLSFHREHQANLTVAVQQYEVAVPYGVIQTEGHLVRSLREKPKFQCFVNAGIYLIEPSSFRFVPKSKRFDMTDLIQKLLDEGQIVVSFPIHEYWLDIGKQSDYEKAKEDIKTYNNNK